MTKTTVEINPGAEIIISLQRTGYSYHQAILDIIDNSVDALRERYNATGKEDGFVRLHVAERNKAPDSIVISDNGVGISADNLKEILRMGTSKKRGNPDALGTFGMGLKTAGMSLGNRITVVSTDSGVSSLRSVEWDIEHCLENGVLEVVYRHIPTDEQLSLYQKYVGDSSGTVVLIDKINDKLPATAKAINDRMKNWIHHAYRHILNPNLTFLNQNFPLKIYHGKGNIPVKTDEDPLCIDDARTQILIGGSDGSFEDFTFNGFEFKVRMTHFRNNDKINSSRPDGLGRHMGNLRHTGIYWIRNGRELAVSSYLGLRRSSLANVYAEISFKDSGLPNGNELISMDFGKKGVEVQEDLKNYMVTYIFGPQINKLVKQADANAKARAEPTRRAEYKKLEAVKISPDIAGRERNTQTPKEKAAADVFRRAASTTNTGRTNSMYRGTSIKSGNNDLQIEIQEVAWPGSPLPYDLEFEAGDPVAKIMLNVEHDWIDANIIKSRTSGHCALALQAISAMAVSLLHMEEQDRRALLIQQGQLLTLWPSDFAESPAQNTLTKEEAA